MAIEYAGTATYHSTITVVDDSDPPTAASFAAGLQDSADREAYLKSKADAFDSANTRLGTLVPGYGGNTIRTYGRESVTSLTNSSAIIEYEAKGLGDPYQIAKVSEPNSEEIWIALTPTAPAGAKIVQISWWVDGASWATMPSVNAYVDLMQRNVITGSTASIISFTDAAATVGEMNGPRQITTNLVAHTISSACQYYLRLTAPTGGTGALRYLLARGAYIAMVAP
jgi:hypothetical protein